MASTRQANLLFLLFTLIFAAIFIQGSRIQAVIPHTQKLQFSSPHKRESHLQGSEEQWEMSSRNSRRLMIGSTAPTCTYNECRGCRYKCRAEQVPVEGNDPINSAYHYKCVCHG